MVDEGARRLVTQPGDSPLTGAGNLDQALAGVPAAVVRPGDTLVFSFPHKLSEQDVDDLTRQFKAGMPEGVKACFVDQCSGIAVVPPDAAV